MRLEGGPFVLIATASAPSPAYQPGHSHCDALSFELSVGGRRVVTDTGVFEYQGPRRRAARATASHATVQVEGHEQSELWADYRIGSRADVGLVRADPPRRAEAVCAGWATPEVLHRRVFEVDAEEVRLEDDFDVAARHAALFLPLAPGLEPRLSGSEARVALPGGRALVVALPEEARWRVERTPYFPEFGRSEERATLVGEAAPLTRARWRIRVV